jgi:hypothetical protein
MLQQCRRVFSINAKTIVLLGLTVKFHMQQWSVAHTMKTARYNCCSALLLNSLVGDTHHAISINTQTAVLLASNCLCKKIDVFFFGWWYIRRTCTIHTRKVNTYCNMIPWLVSGESITTQPSSYYCY